MIKDVFVAVAVNDPESGCKVLTLKPATDSTADPAQRLTHGNFPPSAGVITISGNSDQVLAMRKGTSFKVRIIPDFDPDFFKDESER